VEPETLHNMARAAPHRGPDGIRHYVRSNTGIANLALNVTPESEYEKQPLLGKGNNLILTADARVDNREELIRALRTKGHLRDDAPTDADVILAAYERWGEECALHIIGDFAFAVWDAARQRLFAARDTAGRRAFYYRVEPRRTLFATEVQQILAAPGVPVRLFEPMVATFLAGEGGFQEWTFYEGISQLPPAHSLTVDESGSRVRRYWDIDPDRYIEYADEDEYAEHFTEVFLEAVRCRLRSAKPVGIYLSGGLDSGSIASAAGWLLNRPHSTDTPSLHPYCFAFEEFASADERHISDVIARHYGLPVTNVPADTAWPLKDYPHHGPDRDDPFMGMYQVLHEQTLAMARDEGMGSMLTGGFGDLMAGLNCWDYVDLLCAGRWQGLWSELREHGRWLDTPTDRMLRAFVWSPFKRYLWPEGKAKRLRRAYRLALRHPQPPERYPPWIRSEFAARVGLDDILRESVPRSPVKGFARSERYRAAFDSFHTLGAVWGDRLRGRYGMYETDPWADRRVTDFLMAVPPGVLNRAGEHKRLVRRSMRGIMPEEARRTSTKIYPTPLFYKGVKENSVDTVLDLTTSSKAEAWGYLDEPPLADNYAAFRRGEHRDATFWFALNLEMWLRSYWS
jgi:asparagine synthase (glutamine-hydrolysing)